MSGCFEMVHNINIYDLTQSQVQVNEYKCLHLHNIG